MITQSKQSKINIVEDLGTILIIDDDELVLTALEMTLQREGYHVYTAKNGTEAIQKLNQINPALIICDQIMPGISGVEVLKQAKKLHPDSVRVLITAATDPKTAIEAINVGHVHQYLTKPWQDEQLRKIVRSSLDKYKLAKENLVLQELILHQHTKLKETHEGLTHELKLGARIHEQLLIGKIPQKIPGIVIDALSYPSKEIDGDFYEFYQPNKRYIDLVLGDVMGKGISASLVGTAVKMQLIRFALPFPYQQSYEKAIGWQSNQLPPQEVISHVHCEITDSLIDLEYFVSLLYGRFDLQYMTFTYVDCGSTKPIHFKAKEKTATPLEGNNFPLGVISKTSYTSITTTFSNEDIFVFYSDGVTEARSPSNEFFGIERLTQLVLKNNTLPASELISLIKQTVFDFTQKEKLDDDLTVVIVKIDDLTQPEPPLVTSSEFQCSLSQLSAVRELVKNLCLQAPGDNIRLAGEMQLVINEAFCNVVRHGGLETPESMITIKGELQKDGVFIEMTDHGKPYHPSLIEEPKFDGNNESGYGWHLIKELTDKITYTRESSLNKNNRLSFYKSYYFGDSQMQIKHEKRGKILVITPEGESLDAKGAPQFKESVIELINDNQSGCVVFDLNHLQFIDSSGLGSFLSVLRLLNSQNGDLKLSNLNKPIRTMFELVKMHKIFEIFNSTDDAINSFTC